MSKSLYHIVGVNLGRPGDDRTVEVVRVVGTPEHPVWAFERVTDSEIDDLVAKYHRAGVPIAAQELRDALAAATRPPTRPLVESLAALEEATGKASAELAERGRRITGRHRPRGKRRRRALRRYR